MKDSVESRTMRTLARMKDIWEANIVANKPLIKQDASVLWNDFEKIDGILIAAGASLAKSIPQIAERARSSIRTEICAVDMAAKYLIDNGIRPDYVVCCEGRAEAVKMFDFDSTMPLICDVATHPEIVKNWKGPIFFFVITNFCIDLDNDRQTFIERHRKLSGVATSLVVGGNVGSAGLSFLLSVRNCKNVHLYGHDFSWEKGGDFYCGGVRKEMAQRRVDTETKAGTLYEKRDMHGNDVLTNMSFETFLDWYKEVMRMYPDVIINHTNAGLLY